MYLEQFQYITEVARTKSISNAAQNLHVSQSGISRSINNLEEIIGVKIFERSRHGTIPTKKGVEVIKKAHEIIYILENLYEDSNSKNTLVKGSLKIEANPTLFMNILLKALPAFTKKYPMVEVEIKESNSATILENISGHHTDIGLILNTPPVIRNYKNELQYEMELEGKIYAYVSSDSPLANNKFVTPKDLYMHPFVLYNSNLWLNFVEEHFYGFPTNILFRSNNTSSVLEAVSDGIGIGFTTNIALKNNIYLMSGKIKPILFKNPEPCYRTYNVVTSKFQSKTIVVEEFIKHLNDVISNSKFHHPRA